MGMAELGEIPLNRLAEQVQAALLRLHLMVTGESHRLLAEYGTRVRALLLDRAGEEGTVDAVSGFGVLAEATADWGETFGRWREMFEAARWAAVALPFGALARQHQAMMGLVVEEMAPPRSPPPAGGRRLVEQEGETAFSPVFEPQLQAVLDAANQRVYSDGFQLSQRIWRLNQDSLGGIRLTLVDGITNGDSAWNIAKGLESYLGANAECPRWASTRLYKLTPTERMTSRRGLHSRLGDMPCKSVGVAYNALRLARNEIQIAHHLATDEIFTKAPWIEKEQVCLSPDHPPIGCECENVVAGGEDGDGVYPKGEIVLPIHVQCLCYKIAVLMSADQFVEKLRGRMTGTAAWPEMDQYGDYVGVGMDDPRLAEPGLLASWGPTLVTWLWGNREALGAALGL